MFIHIATEIKLKQKFVSFQPTTNEVVLLWFYFSCLASFKSCWALCLLRIHKCWIKLTFVPKCFNSWKKQTFEFIVGGAGVTWSKEKEKYISSIISGSSSKCLNWCVTESGMKYSLLLIQHVISMLFAVWFSSRHQEVPVQQGLSLCLQHYQRMASSLFALFYILAWWCSGYQSLNLKATLCDRNH